MEDEKEKGMRPVLEVLASAGKLETTLPPSPQPLPPRKKVLLSRSSSPSVGLIESLEQLLRGRYCHYPSFTDGKVRHRRVKVLTQGHTAVTRSCRHGPLTDRRNGGIRAALEGGLAGQRERRSPFVFYSPSGIHEEDRAGTVIQTGCERVAGGCSEPWSAVTVSQWAASTPAASLRCSSPLHLCCLAPSSSSGSLCDPTHGLFGPQNPRTSSVPF